MQKRLLRQFLIQWVFILPAPGSKTVPAVFKIGTSRGRMLAAVIELVRGRVHELLITAVERGRGFCFIILWYIIIINSFNG